MFCSTIYYKISVKTVIYVDLLIAFQEMESVFGEPPSNGPNSSGSVNLLNDESQFLSEKKDESASGLTHTSSTGEAQMVDVSPKPTR